MHPCCCPTGEEALLQAVELIQLASIGDADTQAILDQV